MMEIKLDTAAYEAESRSLISCFCGEASCSCSVHFGTSTVSSQSKAIRLVEKLEIISGKIALLSMQSTTALQECQMVIFEQDEKIGFKLG